MKRPTTWQWILIPDKETEIVSKKEADRRAKEKNPLWEGYVSEIVSKCHKFVILEKFNKYRCGDFYEKFKYRLK